MPHLDSRVSSCVVGGGVTLSSPFITFISEITTSWVNNTFQYHHILPGVAAWDDLALYSGNKNNNNKLGLSCAAGAHVALCNREPKHNFSNNRIWAEQDLFFRVKRRIL